MKLDSYWEAEETPRWIKLSDKYDGWGACARRALFVVLSASHWNCGMGPNGACPTLGSPPLAPLRSLYWLKAATGCHRCGWHRDFPDDGGWRSSPLKCAGTRECSTTRSRWISAWLFAGRGHPQVPGCTQVRCMTKPQSAETEFSKPARAGLSVIGCMK